MIDTTTTLRLSDIQGASPIAPAAFPFATSERLARPVSLVHLRLAAVTLRKITD